MRARTESICGWKPMSSILSASSSTRKRHAFRSVTGGESSARMSLMRPGVATTTAGRPRLSTPICGPFGVPPYTHATLTPAGVPKRSASKWICTASSRVGASTTASGPVIASSGSSSRTRWKMGSRKPSVLPLPVFATAMMSLPPIAIGQACAWTGDGSVHPSFWNCCRMRVSKGASEKARTGSGSASDDSIRCFARHTSADSADGAAFARAISGTAGTAGVVEGARRGERRTCASSSRGRLRSALSSFFFAFFSFFAALSVVAAAAALASLAAFFSALSFLSFFLAIVFSGLRSLMASRRWIGSRTQV
mmetsp:Transcript_13908/g.44655  ORF Transcript_13908/g.44655 Transcript_13908/m.44655 type:complete len:309 (+) Transcript_13908:982-1908(+)